MSAVERERVGPVARLLIGLFRLWQWVPRIDPQRCRYYPSCSAYGITAVRRFGAIRGTWLAACRVGRCHPWNPGGVDHVPERHDHAETRRPPAQRVPNVTAKAGK